LLNLNIIACMPETTSHLHVVPTVHGQAHMVQIAPSLEDFSRGRGKLPVACHDV